MKYMILQYLKDQEFLDVLVQLLLLFFVLLALIVGMTRFGGFADSATANSVAIGHTLPAGDPQ